MHTKYLNGTFKVKLTSCDFDASIKMPQTHTYYSVKLNNVCNVQTQTRTL